MDAALKRGRRGWARGGSLARLLQEQRHASQGRSRPPLTEAQILAWADAHYVRTGRWPTLRSGAVEGAEAEDWGGVDRSLARGDRGLPGGASLALLLDEQRGPNRGPMRPALTVEQILAGADEHYARTGQWPSLTSGPIPAAPGEYWAGVWRALVQGQRGLTGGITLTELLALHRRVDSPPSLTLPAARPPLTVERILAWADAYRQRTGRWPGADSGAIPEAPGETWEAVNASLVYGDRGLPGSCPLARFLLEFRAMWRRHDLPDLAIPQILDWIDAYQERHGHWPHVQSGAVAQTAGESWLDIERPSARESAGCPAAPRSPN